MNQIFHGQWVDYELAARLAKEQKDRDNAPQTQIVETNDWPLEMTTEEAKKHLPKEVLGAMGTILPFQGKWCVRLPDMVGKHNGKEHRVQRFLSSNGNAMRVFVTKEQAEKALDYYQQLMIAQAAMREEIENIQKENVEKSKPDHKPEENDEK